MNKLAPDPVLPPSLSPALLSQFSALSGGGRSMFKRLYFALWRYLWPISRLDQIALAYPAPLILAQANLLPSDYWLLCRLWVLSSGGRIAVNSRYYPFTKVHRQIIADNIKRGYLVRTSFDPANPHAVRPSHIQRTWISFTPSGVRSFKSLLEQINNYARKDVLAFIDASNQKEPGE
jgi:hypothetical protein